MTLLALTLVLFSAVGLVLHSGGATRVAARRWRALLVVAGLATVLPTVTGSPAEAALVPAVPLGSAAAFSGLAYSTITNTGTSAAFQSLGVSPGSAVTGFPPGVVVPPATIHAADATALTAQTDLTAAYINAASRTPDLITPVDLGGLTLVGGVYASGGALSLTGNLTLDGGGDSRSVFIFQSASTLVTASNASITLVNGAQECNVFWQIGSSATLGTNTGFAGNILALTSITLTTGVTLNGRALANNGAPTMNTNTINAPTCAVTAPTTTPAPLTTAPAPEDVEIVLQQQPTTTRATSSTSASGRTTTRRATTSSTTSGPTALPASGSTSGYQLALATIAILAGTGAIALGRARERSAARRSTG